MVKISIYRVERAGAPVGLEVAIGDEVYCAFADQALRPGLRLGRLGPVGPAAGAAEDRPIERVLLLCERLDPRG